MRKAHFIGDRISNANQNGAIGPSKGSSLHVSQDRSGSCQEFRVGAPGDLRGARALAQGHRGAIGISVASVTSIAASLLEHRLISESAPVAAGQGRPRVPLSVDTDSNLVMGIHLGPRVTGIVLTGLDGVAKASVLVPHSGMAAATAFELVIAQAQKLVADHADGRPVLGTGVATGGIVDREQGLIVENAGAGWSQVPAQRMLEALPQPLVLDNNARAAVAVGGSGRPFAARSGADAANPLPGPERGALLRGRPAGRSS